MLCRFTVGAIVWMNVFLFKKRNNSLQINACLEFMIILAHLILVFWVMVNDLFSLFCFFNDSKKYEIMSSVFLFAHQIQIS